MKLQMVLFASIRERLGQSRISLTVPDSVNTVEALLSHLKAEGADPWPKVLADTQVLVAVNQAVARPEQALAEGDELALFPPVTGG